MPGGDTRPHLVERLVDLLRLVHGHGHAVGGLGVVLEPCGTHLVEQPEVGGLRLLTLLGSDVLRRLAGQPRPEQAVKIVTLPERFQHRLAAGDERGHPQLDLGEVQLGDHAPGAGDERGLENLGHLLHVRLAGGQAPGDHAAGVVRGMDRPPGAHEIKPARQVLRALDGAAQLQEIRRHVAPRARLPDEDRLVPLRPASGGEPSDDQVAGGQGRLGPGEEPLRGGGERGGCRVHPVPGGQLVGQRPGGVLALGQVLAHPGRVQEHPALLDRGQGPHSRHGHVGGKPPNPGQLQGVGVVRLLGLRDVHEPEVQLVQPPGPVGVPRGVGPEIEHRHALCRAGLTQVVIVPALHAEGGRSTFLESGRLSLVKQVGGDLGVPDDEGREVDARVGVDPLGVEL